MRSDFSETDFTGANLEMTRLQFAWLARARIVGANLQEAKFVTTNLRGATFEGNFLRYTIFPDSDFEGCEGCPNKEDWK
jgi:uncharacterized protein YjbI with pentapeptide repeats